MRFFKYLIFIFISLISAFSFASSYSGSNTKTPPFYSSCSDYASKQNYFWYQVEEQNSYEWGLQCYLKTQLKDGDAKNSTGKQLYIVPDQCFYPDYKIVSQPITSLKKTMCLPVNGAICKYVGDPTGSPVVNGKITTTFSSVSKTPDPTCKEE